MAQVQHPGTEQSSLNLISQSCEKLITQTQTDLELFRHEQNQLREQILGMLEENHRQNTKLEVLKSAANNPSDSRDDATREKLTKEALKNVQQQIDYLQAENRELRLLNKASRKTIQNLENEIQNYRTQIFQPSSVVEVKQKFGTTIKLLECTITSQKSELAKQSQVIEKLFQQKREMRESIQQLQAALKAKERKGTIESNHNEQVEKLQEQLAEATRQRKDLEKSLRLSKRVIEERFEREKHALQKVQEALSIAEAAVADKETAQKREQVVKEECDNLASTIGLIMEEAARKVEKDMETLKNNFSEKEKALLEKQEKLNEDLLNNKKLNDIFETRCNRIEQRYKEVVKENEKLSTNLQIAMQSLGEMELKLANSEHLLQADKQAEILAKERDKEIQHYIQIYKQSKEKCTQLSFTGLIPVMYKAAMEDVTQKFEKEIYRLQTENANLKADQRVFMLKQNSPREN